MHVRIIIQLPPTVLLILAIVGCPGNVPLPDGIGDGDGDMGVLEDKPHLRHLADALNRSADVTVADLFLDEELEFVRSPDPSQLFEDRYWEHQLLPSVHSFNTVKVLTYNTGLLSRTYLGNLVEVPEYEARREVMPHRVVLSGFDVLLLQEVWEWEDAVAIAEVAEGFGFATWYGDEETHVQHGTFMAVRESLIDDSEDQDKYEFQFESQYKAEESPGPNIKRGWLEWEFTLADNGRRVRLYCAHASAFPEQWLRRDLQMREMGMSMRTVEDETILLVGGDMNAGPYYKTDIWTGPDGDIEGWWDNARAYPLLMHYGELWDVHGAAQILQDVVRGDTVPIGVPGMTVQPYGDVEWCADTPSDTFTGSDCNSLYFDNYAATEFPARLDHLMVRDHLDGVRVVSSELQFVEPIDWGWDVQFELSDHYGVGAELRIGKAE
jgi:hypothetical protein